MPEEHEFCENTDAKKAPFPAEISSRQLLNTGTGTGTNRQFNPLTDIEELPLTRFDFGREGILGAHAIGGRPLCMFLGIDSSAITSRTTDPINATMDLENASLSNSIAEIVGVVVRDSAQSSNPRMTLCQTSALTVSRFSKAARFANFPVFLPAR